MTTRSVLTEATLGRTQGGPHKDFGRRPRKPDARSARGINRQRIDPDDACGPHGKRAVHLGVDRRLEGGTFKRDEGGHRAVEVNLCLLDAHPPVKLCVCHQAPAVFPVTEKHAAPATDEACDGATERNTRAVGRVHPAVTGGREAPQRIRQKPESRLLDTRPPTVLDKIQQHRSGSIGRRKHHPRVPTHKPTTSKQRRGIPRLIRRSGPRQQPQRTSNPFRLVPRLRRRVGYRRPVHGINGVRGHPDNSACPKHWAWKLGSFERNHRSAQQNPQVVDLGVLSWSG